MKGGVDKFKHPIRDQNLMPHQPMRDKNLHHQQDKSIGEGQSKGKMEKKGEILNLQMFYMQYKKSGNISKCQSFNFFLPLKLLTISSHHPYNKVYI